MRTKQQRDTMHIAKVSFLSVTLALAGCSSTMPNRNPSGELFPTVRGQSLEKEMIEIPGGYAGRPVILMIGYKQSAQFDIDRWVMGFMQAKVSVPMVELPTIPGLMPSMASRWIDDGMRSGIPREDWAAVVTLYGKSASPIAKLTGTSNGQRARIIVLDANGKIVWFDDKGYSAKKALEVQNLAASLDS